MNLSNHPVAIEVQKIALLQKFPMLQAVEGYKSLVTAAKNIRTELKATYPKTKFSVRSESFSGGDAIRISWTDGPNADQVDAIVGKYSAGSFNGMEDIYEYSRNAFNMVFGDAKYITTSRDCSDDMIESAIAGVVKYYGGCEPISVEDYRQGRSWRWMNSGGVDMGRALSQRLQKMSRELPASKGNANAH
jgi:hypothetical protein